MPTPLDPERAKKIAGRVKDLSDQASQTGQAAAGEYIRDPARSQLPFENNPDGTLTARIPLPDGGNAGVSYDPQTPPQTDFDFSVQAPDGSPRNVPGIPGMKDGKAKIPPMDVGPAIEKASGIDRTTAFATRSNITPDTRQGIIGKS